MFAVGDVVERTAISTLRAGTPLYADAAHVIRRHGSFLLTFSLAAPNAASLRAWASAIEQLDSPVLVMIVIDSSARAPDGPTKDAIQQTTLRLQHRIAAFAYVVEGEGFTAAAVRGAISLIGMFAHYAFPQRVVATVNEAAAWLRRNLPASGDHSHDAAEITRAIDAMRAELRGNAPGRRLSV